MINKENFSILVNKLVIIHRYLRCIVVLKTFNTLQIQVQIWHLLERVLNSALQIDVTFNSTLKVISIGLPNPLSSSTIFYLEAFIFKSLAKWKSLAKCSKQRQNWLLTKNHGWKNNVQLMEKCSKMINNNFQLQDFGTNSSVQRIWRGHKKYSGPKLMFQFMISTTSTVIHYNLITCIMDSLSKFLQLIVDSVRIRKS